MILPEYLTTPIYAENAPPSKTSVPTGNSGTAAYSSDSAIKVYSLMPLVWLLSGIGTKKNALSSALR